MRLGKLSNPYYPNSCYWLYSAILIFLSVWNPFYRQRPINYLEASIYLGPLQRLLTGAELATDVQILFGPYLFLILKTWMGWFGFTYHSMQTYFLCGWILLFFVVAAICLLTFSKRRNAYFAFSTFCLLLSPIAHEFTEGGGVRFLCGPLVIAFLANPFARSVPHSISLFIGGFISIAGFAIAPYQAGAIFLALLVSFIVGAFAANDRAAYLQALYIPFMAGLAGASAALVNFYLSSSMHLIPFLRDASSYHYWLQPMSLTPTVFLNLLSVFFLVLFFISMMQRGNSRQKIFIEHKRLLIISYFLILFFYGLRASVHSQMLVGSSYLCLATLLCLDSLMTEKVCSISKKCIITSAAFAIIGTFSWNTLVPGQALFQKLLLVSRGHWTPNYECRPVSSSIPRLAGSCLPESQAQDIESLFSTVQSSMRPADKYFIMPEHGVLEFIFDKTAVGRFPVANLANARLTWTDEVLETLRRDRPAYIIRSVRRSALSYSINSSEELLPEVRKYVDTFYIVDKRINSFEILVRSVPNYISHIVLERHACLVPLKGFA